MVSKCLSRAHHLWVAACSSTPNPPSNLNCFSVSEENKQSWSLLAAAPREKGLASQRASCLSLRVVFWAHPSWVVVRRGLGRTRCLPWGHAHTSSSPNKCILSCFWDFACPPARHALPATFFWKIIPTYPTPSLHLCRAFSNPPTTVLSSVVSPRHFLHHPVTAWLKRSVSLVA